MVSVPYKPFMLSVVMLSVVAPYLKLTVKEKVCLLLQLFILARTKGCLPIIGLSITARLTPVTVFTILHFLRNLRLN